MNMKMIYCAFFLSLLLTVSLAGCGSGGGSATSAVNSQGSEGGAGGASATGIAKLAWDAPTDLNGAPRTDLAGYKVYYGTSSRNYSNTINTGAATTCSVSDLPPGMYYFSVTAYDTSGKESTFSNEVTKTIQ